MLNANIETNQISATNSSVDERGTLTENDQIPPFWDLSVSRHQTSMDIRLLVYRSPRLGPNLLPEEQECMGKCCGDRGER